MSAQEVIEALKSLVKYGPDGLRLAAAKEPALTGYLLEQVGDMLATTGISAAASIKDHFASTDDAPDRSTEAETGRQNVHKARNAAEAKKSLMELHGSRSFTYMIQFIILQHLSDHPREKNVQTIFDELKSAQLCDKRMSLVTTLNRMKNDEDKKYVEWSRRGGEIKITQGGQGYLANLIEHRLQAWQIDFLRQYASPSISAKLPVKGST